MRERLILCGARFVGTVFLVATFAFMVKILGLDYGDAKASLALFNAYFPELVALALFSSIAFVFYRASATRPDFNFICFFITKPGVHEDIGKLIFFLLGVTVIWSYFALYWREKLDTAYVVGTLTVFIVQGIAAIAGRSFGKKRPDEPPPSQS